MCVETCIKVARVKGEESGSEVVETSVMKTERGRTEDIKNIRKEIVEYAPCA